MNTKVVVGIDPGPVTGLVRLDWSPGTPPRVFFAQADPDSARELVGSWVRHGDNVRLAVEDYVIGNQTMKAGSQEAQRQTRDMLSWVRVTHRAASVRKAAEVKPWATDKRLEAAGILGKLQGMRHARDAARHALFALVRDGGMPDPLSKAFPG